MIEIPPLHGTGFPPTGPLHISQVNRGLEWLMAERNYGYRRHAACLVLRELAKNAPTVFFVKRGEFFQRIWPVLGDSKEFIRKAAVEACAHSPFHQIADGVASELTCPI